MRRAHRIDANQSEIVAAIRSIPGWGWTALPPDARIGDGLFRIASWPDGVVWQLEIKTDKGKLKPEQVIREQQGWIKVIRSFDELWAMVNERRVA